MSLWRKLLNVFCILVCVGCLLYVVHDDTGAVQPAVKHTSSSALLAKIQTAKEAANKPAKPVPKVAAVPKLVSPCAAGSVLDIVAHEDDDILFMNPNLQAEIAAGMCVRTVYLTAGDDGQKIDYWRLREQGPEAAYAVMASAANTWQPSILTAGGASLSMQTLASNSRISLVFMRLPDGNLNGQGFASTNYESLQKLYSGNIASISAVDGGNTFTLQQLVGALHDIIAATKPTIINTQAFSPALAGGDHSDHQMTGTLAVEASRDYKLPLRINRFLGYQIGSMAPNLTYKQSQDKQAIFNAYSQDDGMICHEQGCTTDYNQYMTRQYEQLIKY